jgi:zinc/manganese transport system ATP-binding protein
MPSASASQWHAAEALHQAAVRLHNLTVSYRQRPVLHHLSGEFAMGSLTAVVGPNGSGKSTLLKSMANLLPLGAAYARNAVQVQVARPHIAYLPQHSEIDRQFPMAVHDCVLLGMWAHRGALGGASAAMLAAVDAALRTVGMQGFARQPIAALSAGQLQRVLFARLLVQDAQLILLDEPFTAIDASTTAGLLRLVRRWHQQGRTVVAVLHDDAQVQAHFPDTLLLAREPVAWGATPQVMTAANLQRARALADAWDASTEREAPWCEVDHTAHPGAAPAQTL